MDLQEKVAELEEVRNLSVLFYFVLLYFILLSFIFALEMSAQSHVTFHLLNLQNKGSAAG